MRLAGWQCWLAKEVGVADADLGSKPSGRVAAMARWHGGGGDGVGRMWREGRGGGRRSEPWQPAAVAGDGGGNVKLFAQPFVTAFDPAPGATGVARSSSIACAIVTAVGNIDRASINASVNGAPIVVSGVEQNGARL